MDRFADIRRAAKLVGVTRGSLQRRIDNGEITTQDGMVEMHELIRVFPELDKSRSSMVEVVDQIKDDAIIKTLTRKEDVIREAYE